MNTKKIELALYYLLLDLFLLNVSLYLAHNLGLVNGPVVDLEFRDFIQESFAWTVTYFVMTKKNLFLRDGFANRAWRISLRTVVYIFFSLVISVFVVEYNTAPKEVYLLFLYLFFGLRILVYYGLYKIVRIFRSKGRFVKRTLIVGSDETSKYLESVLNNNKILGYQCFGFVSNDAEAGALGPLNALEQIIEDLGIEVFFVTFSIFKQQPHLEELLQLSINKGIRIKLVPQKEVFFNFKNENSIGGITVIDPFDFPLNYLGNRIQKRIFDLLFSTFVIVFVLSWFLPLAGLLTLVSSRGPVFFLQKRTGMSNKTFTCIKLRTMKQNSTSDAEQAKDGDVRITKFGDFLRKSNLDEMPQFLNVFLGDMSVVGPRPHMLFHTDLYSKEIQHYKSRHFIKPGITGWAQVNGLRGETDELWKMEKRVEYDLEYLENWSMVKDLKIVFATVFSERSYMNAV